MKIFIARIRLRHQLRRLRLFMIIQALEYTLEGLREENAAQGI